MLLLSLAAAATLYVPGDHDDLPSACAAAADGDVISVDSGKAEYEIVSTYCGISNKTVTIEGAAPDTKVGPIIVQNGALVATDLSVQNAGGSGNLVLRSSSLTGERLTLQPNGQHGLVVTEGSSVDVTGFTASGFTGTSNAVVINGTDAAIHFTLTECELADNRNSAIAAAGGNVVEIRLVDCSVTGNGTGFPPSGAGLYTVGAGVSVIVDGGEWSNNNAADSGGAIHTSGDLNLGNVVFKANQAQQGAAVWHKGGDLVLASVRFEANTSLGATGGALLTAAPARFDLLAVDFLHNSSLAATPGTSGLVANQLPDGALFQYGRFCGNGPKEPATEGFANAALFNGSGSVQVFRSVFDQQTGADLSAVLQLSGGGVFSLEHNTFANNADSATLFLGAGTLRFYNNFVDGETSALNLSGSIVAENNAFRGIDVPSGWSSSFSIVEPDYLAYGLDIGCDADPQIGEKSELRDRGSEDVQATNADDEGKPDVGAYWFAGAPVDTGDTGETGETGETGDTSITEHSGEPRDSEPLPGFEPTGASGGCTHAGGGSALLLLLLARRRR